MKSLAIISPLECTGTAVLVRTYTPPHAPTHTPCFCPRVSTWVLCLLSSQEWHPSQAPGSTGK